MKLIILMIIFPLTVLVSTFTESTEIDKNSILIENLGGESLAQHTSRIQQRSILKLFGLKPRYRPIQISLNRRKTNQQRLTINNYNPFKYEIINRRPTNNFLIQKNFIFYNGLNQANNQHNPEIYVSTSPKYSTSTEDVLSNPAMQQTETTTNFNTATEATTTFIKQQSTQNTANRKTTQIYQITTSTTSKPQSEKPVTINFTTTTEPTLNNNPTSTKGGFTSISMPQENEYSELIYDINPRYKKRSVK